MLPESFETGCGNELIECLMNRTYNIYVRFINHYKGLCISVLVDITKSNMSLTFLCICFIIMTLEDEYESEVYNFFHVIVIILIAVYFFTSEINFAQISIDKAIEVLFPIAFVAIFNLPIFKNKIGKADVYFFVESMLVYALTDFNKMAWMCLLSWLIAYIIHAVRNVKHIKHGKLVEPRPFMLALITSFNLMMALNLYIYLG